MKYTLMMMIMMGSNLDLEVYAKCECNISSLLGGKKWERTASVQDRNYS